jgi:hypothetical protein
MKLVTVAFATFIFFSFFSTNPAFSEGSEKGDAILRKLLEYVTTRGNLSCQCHFDIAGKFEDKNYNFSGTSQLAFDLRNRSTEQIGIEADSSIKGNPVKVVINSLGLNVRFYADISGQAPMAYSVDFATLGQRNNSSDSSTVNGGVLSEQNVHKIYKNTIREAQKALSPEGRKTLVEDALARTSKYTTVKYIAPNCLQFIPKKGQKLVSELYYNRNTQLVDSLIVHDPHSKVTTKLVFSNWNIDSSVSFPVEPRGVRYRDFDQQAIGKILGTVLGLFSGESSSQETNYGEREASYIENRLKALDSPEFKMKIKEARESAASGTR